jgi:hypothetical protein
MIAFSFFHSLPTLFVKKTFLSGSNFRCLDSEVVEIQQVVRDKIKQKIRSNLANELEKVREEEEKKLEVDEEGRKKRDRQKSTNSNAFFDYLYAPYLIIKKNK